MAKKPDDSDFEQLEGRVVKIEKLLKAVTGVDLETVTSDELDAFLKIHEAGGLSCYVVRMWRCSAFSPEPRPTRRTAAGHPVGAVRRFAELGG
jgi:hypothetical protein